MKCVVSFFKGKFILDIKDRNKHFKDDFKGKKIKLIYCRFSLPLEVEFSFMINLVFYLKMHSTRFITTYGRGPLSTGIPLLPFHELLFSNGTKRYFVCITYTYDGTYHSVCYTSMEH